jgi:formylglycine-generating enzyme required for sulfatase activity
MVWLPNESVARQWQRFVKGDPFETVAAATPRRLAVPDPSAQERAKKLVEDVFQEEIEKADTIAAKQTLARRLFQQAVETEDDVAARFVLFRMARETAADAGDGQAAFAVIEKTAECFDIDPFAMKRETLSGFAGTARTVAAHQAVAEKALAVLDEAMTANEFEVGRELGKLAFAEASKCRKRELLQMIRSRAKDLQEARKAFAEVEEAAATLKKAPDDPDANSAVGKYTCFVKGDWDTGLPMLAKGSDSALKTLASKDLQMPVEPKEQEALADAWYELASEKGSTARKNLQLRAAHWYWHAYSGLKGGMEKVKVEKRMKTLAPLVATLPVPRGIINKRDGSELILIPAGKFLAGEGKTITELPAYYLGEYPVTNTQYKRFLDSTDRPSPPGWHGKDFPVGSDGDGALTGASWDDAQAYCRWADVRLPTGLEWEKGARGTDGRAYPWGDKWDIHRIRETIDGKPCNVKSHPEGQSPYGICDLIGNVWQWCADPIKSKGRMLRGTSWDDAKAGGYFEEFTCAHCDVRPPETRGFGFRVAKSIMP